jgi:predicted Zn-dependent protease
LLEALDVLQKSRQEGGIFNTHPAPSERISNAQQRTAGLKSPDTQSARKARFNTIMGRKP